VLVPDNKDDSGGCVMDSTLITIIVIVALFAIVSIVGFFIYRTRARLTIKAPFNSSIEFDGSQDAPQAQRIQEMRRSESGDQEMSGQGKQKQSMEDSPHGKQKMS
jgi:hypothetical protein